ncbi:MAG: hypothetical protein GC159_01085 [Phycisphaera sp.]|nr:hypothetical protein [Phycisphaera sp.]
MSNEFNWDQHAKAHPSSAMAGSTPAPSSWSEEQLAAELAALLESPIGVIAGGDPRAESHVTDLAERHDPLLRYVVDMIRNPHPPVQLLEMAKGFAKYSYRNRNETPKPVWLVFYYLVIVVALLRRDKRITSLKHHALRRGVAFSASEPWIDPETSVVLQEGLTLLDHRIEATEANVTPPLL